MGNSTEVRVLVILVPGAPEERTNARGTFNYAIRQVQSFYHGPVDIGLKTDDMRSEGFRMLGIFLETWGRQLCCIFQGMETNSH